MDQYLRRLKQELLSMKEVGEGLQDQMNCMMGALQELKLLQVQAALEQLEISGAQNQVYSVGQNQCCRNGREAFEVRKESSQRAEKPTTGVRSPDNRLLAFSQGFQAVSSLNSSMPGTSQGHQVFSEQGRETEIRHLSSSNILAAVESWPTTESQFTGVDFESQHPMDVTIVLSDQEKCIDEPVPDEAKDWTSSLMSQSRNRQPLVLGDNIFADLVGNWLDLPELEKKGGKTDNILSVSRSQEIYKKFSLTANFFKKFLRSVRPDRDKLLKEKPGWLQAEDQAAEISKRPKKAKKQNSVFYFPSQSDIKSTHSKAEKRGKKEEKCNATRRTCTTEGQKKKDYVHTGFDMNTAVWV
ncbi:PAK4-inhibitor INKA2 [Ascaphus truei]|uniref:PAK4-inhibitor INKA2 n=1 Tax=Ascaphus truei TaxID=8439 RepID=UPI003F592753